MTAGNVVVKLTAKTALKGNWLKASVSCIAFIFAFFICFETLGFAEYIFNGFTAVCIFFLLTLFLLFPLFMGVLRFFWRMIFSADDNPVTVFYYFSDKNAYLRSLKVVGALLIRCVGLGILFFLPAIIVDILSNVKIYDFMNIPTPLWTDNLFYISIFLKSVASVVLFFAMIKYYLAPFLAIADEKMDISEAMHMSAIISKKTYFDFIYMLLSFAGFFLLSLLVFPIIFIMPYFLTAFCVHIRFAVAEYNKSVGTNAFSSAPTFAAGI